ncbi:MAG: hypothetical protein GEV08_06200 [Acidimicrobiia bacterium]|nr:hypothetical protein [Acidimicrobiia bacterium]
MGELSDAEIAGLVEELGPLLDDPPPEEAPEWASWSHRRLRVGRGWTDALIRDFLGEPDRLGVNVFNRRKESRRYLIHRVLAVEATPQWREAYEKARKRSEAAKRRVAEHGQKPPPGRWPQPE